jgi:hypothetical protein
VSAPPSARVPGQGALRLAAVSVDLDEIGEYHAIHGLAAPATEGRPIHDVALGRLRSWARGLSIPLTLFVIGSELRRPGTVRVLREAAAEGHELGNHTLDHRYDLTLLPAAEQRRQVEEGSAAIEAACGRRPRGFRAPGYTVSDALLGEVARAGHLYDSSVFPCPAYHLAKLAVIGAMRARGRTSRSIAGDARVLGAPRRPYRLGTPYTTEGAGIVELPLQVTPALRLPIIGTSLALLPAPLSAPLLASCVPGPINLELHGIDALDDHDEGLAALRGLQPELGTPWSTKLARIAAAVGLLRQRGYRFVTLEELAARAV